RSLMNDLARKKLFHIVKTYGRTVCNTPRTCEIFLHQHCEAFPDERQLLVEALRHGTVTDLLDLQAGPAWAVVSEPLVNDLAGRASISPLDARWTVDSWALALGKHPDTAPPPPPPPGLEEPEEEPAANDVASSKLWPPIIVGIGGGIGAVIATG